MISRLAERRHDKLLDAKEPTHEQGEIEAGCDSIGDLVEVAKLDICSTMIEVQDDALAARSEYLLETRVEYGHGLW